MKKKDIKILLVDDEQDILEIVGYNLSQEGYQISTAVNGREAIAKVAQGFMTAFPDMIVSMDSLLTNANGTAFHWTLTGTNTGPGGTGNKVKISGVELWQFDAAGLIYESKGSFDAEEYNRQLGMKK